MSNIPAELKYVATHEWLRLEEDGTLTVGVTDYAQESLGDIVFIELPEVGTVFSVDEQAGVVESVKAASDIYAPIAGEVVAINEGLIDSTEVVNTDPYGEGWFFKIKPESQEDLQKLLTAEEYAQEIA